MKTYNRFHKVLGALLLALGLNVASAIAQTNVLRIGEVTFPAGKTAIVPIELENQSDIVGYHSMAKETSNFNNANPGDTPRWTGSMWMKTTANRW